MLPHDQKPSSSSSSTLPPLQINKTTKNLPPAARRILHSLSTLTSPSLLPSLLSQIISNSFHINHPLLSSTFILTSLLSFTSPSPALRLFSLLPFPPPLHSFNSLLRAFSSPQLLTHSSSFPLLLFRQLLHNGIPPNRHTFPPLLSALSRRPRISQTLPLHSLILKSGFLSDPYVSLSLLHLYSSSSSQIDYCRNLFDEMPTRNRNVVAWTTMIDAHNHAGRCGDALVLFERMQYARVLPNRVTMICALAACSARGELDMGVWIHEFVERSGWKVDVVLGTALVDMYGKCGRAEDGVRVFEGMRERNVCTWNAVIGGFALAKCGEKAVDWLRRMEEEEGVRPDEVTLIEFLRACGHSGLVETGRKVFDSVLKGRFGFRPGIKPYGCMVDLLGRAGFVEEAMELMENMPFEPSVVMWGSLLGGCRSHGNLSLSEVAAKRLMEMEPENVAHYVVLSNLYVEMGRWRDAEEVRRVMKERGMRKDAGWSFTEVDDGRNNFIESSG